MNESILRSPKWLRNIADFEINTGDDIKGKPSKKMQKKIDAENLRKEEEDKARKKEQDRIADELKGKEFDTLLLVTIKYIVDHYKTCKISVPTVNFLTIEDNQLKWENESFDFKVTLDNTITNPKFRVYLKHGKKEYDYTISGPAYSSFKSFLLNSVYVWFDRNRDNKYNKSYADDYYDDYYDKKSSKPESEEIKNKRRRYNLLKDALDGYERQMKTLVAWKLKNGYSHPDEKECQNQIDNVKDKIKKMKDTFKFESLNHLENFEKFNS